MGKIQDAIRKVQSNRTASISATSVSHSVPVDKFRPTSRYPDAAHAAEQSSEGQVWEYRGRKMTVDKRKLIDSGVLDPDHSRKHLANEYRHLKRALLANTVDGENSVASRGNFVMVGSAVSGEGKSFVCLNLSMSLAAEPGYSVVLVDADMENPQISNILGLRNKNGLAELLADPSLDPMEIISSTSVPGLSVLPAGRNREHAAELFASYQASKLFEEMSAADPRRIVMFDSSAIGSSAAALALAGQVGQILFVVQAGKTPRKSVIDALGKLDRTRPINIVLNQVIN